MVTPNSNPQKTRVAHEMHLLGRVLWATGAMRLHADGSSFQAIWRIWHPVTWLVLALAVIPCAVAGERLFRVVPLRLSEFWRLNADQLQWVTPFTRLDSLKPFNFAQARRRRTADDKVLA